MLADGRSREREVTRLLQAVVAAHGAHEGVGVGMLGRDRRCTRRGAPTPKDGSAPKVRDWVSG
jgi:hypothetical protein